jgi:spermidine/putrescine transport system permease protein
VKVGTSRLGSIAGQVYLWAVIAFLFAPALLLLAFSFNTSPFFNLPFTGLTLHWFGVAFRNSAMIDALENSLKVAAPTALISTAIGLVTALGLRGASRWVRRGIDTAVPLPLLVPGMIWSIALLILFTRLDIQPSMWTLLAGHVLLSLPFVVLLITTRLGSFKREWEEAAESLGASRLMFVRRVFIPHMAPALAAGALMAFTISFNDFIVAFFLTGGGFTTLPIYIFSLVRWQSDPSISAVSSMVFVFALVSFLVIAKLQGREINAAGQAAFAGAADTEELS